jgi:hypothetical protein
MSRKDVVREVACKYCGAVHIVTYTYSDFSPANSDHESAICIKCSMRLVRERYLGVDAELK